MMVKETKVKKVTVVQSNQTRNQNRPAWQEPTPRHAGKFKVGIEFLLYNMKHIRLVYRLKCIFNMEIKLTTRSNNTIRFS